MISNIFAILTALFFAKNAAALHISAAEQPPRPAWLNFQSPAETASVSGSDLKFGQPDIEIDTTLVPHPTQTTGGMASLLGLCRGKRRERAHSDTSLSFPPVSGQGGSVVPIADRSTPIEVELSDTQPLRKFFKDDKNIYRSSEGELSGLFMLCCPGPNSLSTSWTLREPMEEDGLSKSGSSDWSSGGSRSHVGLNWPEDQDWYHNEVANNKNVRKFMKAPKPGLGDDEPDPDLNTNCFPDMQIMLCCGADVPTESPLTYEQYHTDKKTRTKQLDKEKARQALDSAWADATTTVAARDLSSGSTRQHAPGLTKARFRAIRHSTDPAKSNSKSKAKTESSHASASSSKSKSKSKRHATHGASSPPASPKKPRARRVARDEVQYTTPRVDDIQYFTRNSRRYDALDEHQKEQNNAMIFTLNKIARVLMTYAGELHKAANERHPFTVLTAVISNQSGFETVIQSMLDGVHPWTTDEFLFPELSQDMVMRLRQVFNQFLFAVERCLDVPDLEKRRDYRNGSTPGKVLPELLATHFRMVFKLSHHINEDFDYEYLMQFSPAARKYLFKENAGPGFPEKSRVHSWDEMQNRQSDKFM